MKKVLNEDKQMDLHLSPDEESSLNVLLEKARNIFTLKNTISSGSFNCAHLVLSPDGKPEVVRIAYLPGLTITSKTTGEQVHLGGFTQIELQNQRIIRGLEIVHLLNNQNKRFDRLIGPSLLKELSPYRVFEEEYEKSHFDGVLCNKVRQTQNTHHALILQKTKGDANIGVNSRFALQHIEYVNGGIFTYKALKKAHSYEKEFIAFSLVWFFTMTGHLFGLRHRDLKIDNILLRISDKEIYKWYTFNLNNEYFFHFKSRLVPVVIDYDFASVYETESPENRNAQGNVLYQPFEATVIKLYNLYNKKAPLELFRVEENYDWWSLGLCLFQMYEPKADMLFQDEGGEYATFIMKTWYHPKPRIADYFGKIFHNACICSIFSQTGSIIRPPMYLYPEVAGTLFPVNMPNMDMKDNAKFMQLYDAVAVAIAKNDPVMLLLSNLLNWNPLMRAQKSHLLLFTHLATTVPYQDAVYEYESPLHLDTVRLKDYPGYENLKTCVSCFISSKNTQLYECVCCQRVYCGQECQKNNH